MLPDQIKRLLVVAILITIGFIHVRKIFIPKSFGEIGHYRADAVTEIMSHDISYAGNQACDDCHDDVSDEKRNSYHRMVNCESCHGPAVSHINSFETDEIELPSAPRDRGYCTLCHGYDPAKPTGFPQIDPIAHNPVKPCISCHDPHVPDPPNVPSECSACHGNIARTKALSPHALLNCIQCHETPDQHKSNPRAIRPSKPQSRDECAVCQISNKLRKLY